jgi:TatD DNase family protein
VIDFHCHLDLYPNPREIAAACVEQNLYVLSVTTTPSAWNGTIALAPERSRIRTALGLHPQLAHLRKSELTLFEALLPDAVYVGEVGLDGAPAFKDHWSDQIIVFERILDLCRASGGRILSIHSRQAATAVLDRLESSRDAGIPVLHWFSGSLQELSRAIDLGCWFSVGPSMIAGNKGRSLVARIPRTRILIESDGPFAQANGRPLLPWDSASVVPHLAQLWDNPLSTVQAQLLANLKRLSSGSDVAQRKGSQRFT